jgi:hypothetical protein
MPLAVFLALALVAVVRPVFAQGFEALGTRAQGMGGAFVAVADDASAVYWNPAGLGTGATVDAQIEVGRQERVFAGLAIPSLGLSYWRLPTVLVSGGRQEEGSGEVRLGVLETSSFGITLLQTVVNGIVVGSTMRLVRGQVGAAGARTSFDLDAGVMASVGTVRVGLTARNLRQPEFPVAGGSQSVSLNRQVRLGVALVPRSRPSGAHGPFTVAADLDLTKSSLGSKPQKELALGGEYWLAAGRLGTRVGLRLNTIGDRDPIGSTGVTVGLPRSMFLEGQVTKGRQTTGKSWGITARVTF